MSRVRGSKPVAAVLLGFTLVASLLVNHQFALAAAPQPIANDTFTRTVASGWGSAELGGAWTLVPAAAPTFVVDKTAGLITLMTDGKSPTARLDAVSSVDTDLTTSFRVSKAATGSGAYIYAIGRRVPSAGQYHATVHLLAGGAVNLSLARRDAASVETTILPAATVAGLTAAADTSLTVRVQVSGTSPTTVRARVWKTGTTEPTSWARTVTDATAALQKAGSLGVSAYLSRTATNAPVVVSVDSFTAAPIAAAEPVPSTTSASPSTPVGTTPTPTATPTVTPTPTPTPTPTTTTPPPTTGTHASDSAGAAAIGTARYAVPANAVFVATNGADSADGSLAHPLATLARAAAVSAAGGTIVLRAGTYHQTTTLPGGKALTVQSYPGEAVWFDGTTVVNPVADGARWRVDGWTSVFDHSPTYTSGAADGTAAGWGFVNAAYPMAAYPDMVWIGSTPQRQVGSLAEVVAGTFWVDTAGQHIYLGSDPAGQTVRSSDLQIAIHAGSAGTVLRGFGVRRYATSVPQVGAVRIVGAGSTVENLVVRDNATQGLYTRASNITVHQVTTSGNGLDGMQANYADGLQVDGLRSVGNNTEHFNRAPVSGGLKITRSRGLTVVNSVIASNLGQGLWFDESCYDITAVGNDLSGNTGNGVVAELSQKMVFADNLVTDNVISGFLVANSGGIAVWNNSFARNNRDIYIHQDSRDQYNLSTAGHDPRQTLPDASVPWKSSGINVRNNVFDNATGNALFAVEDATHTYSAEDLKITADSDVYLRASAVSPTWAVVWSRGVGNPSVFNSAAQFNAGTGQEAHALWLDGTTGASPITAATTASSAAALPASVAALVGVASGTRHFGAWQ
jgi:hypothetical protein